MHALTLGSLRAVGAGCSTSFLACGGKVPGCAAHRAPGPDVVYPSDPGRFPTVSVPLHWPASYVSGAARAGRGVRLRAGRRERRGVAARKKGCGRDFPRFSVKFSPFMYSTGFMSYSTVYWVKHKSATVFDMYPEAARHIHVYDGIYVYTLRRRNTKGENLTEERGERRPLPNPNHDPNSGPDVHRLVYEPP